MNQSLLPIQHYILSFLYQNNPRVYSTGQIHRDKDVYKQLQPSLSPRLQKEEIEKNIEYLAGKGFVTKKQTTLKGSLRGYLYVISTKGIDFFEKEQGEMIVNSCLEKMIDEDIEKLNQSHSYELLEQIKAKYQAYIDAVRDVNFDYFTSSLEKDTGKLQNALLAYKAFGYQNNNQASGKPSIIIKNENINTNSFQINISYSQVREDIRGNTYLTDEQITEIISKIDELEQIDKEGETKKEKWGRVKSILNWLGDKGVDIAVKIIPLVLKIIAQE